MIKTTCRLILPLSLSLAFSASAALTTVQTEQTQARLSTGMRVNSAKDDAAGLEIDAEEEKAAAQAKESQSVLRDADMSEEEAKKLAEQEKLQEAGDGKETAGQEKVSELERRTNSLTRYLRSLERGSVVLTESKNGILGKEGEKLSAEELDATREKLARMEKLSARLFEAPSMKLDINEKENVQVDLSLNQENKDGLKVYTVDGALLSESKTLDFLNVKGDETVVINVTGEKVNWGWTTKYSGANVIWNFEAKSLNIADQDFSGSVLATSAVVNQSREISGSLIARDWVAAETGGVKPLPGKGGGTKIPGVSAPEPTGLLTLGGFLGLATLSRRRQATRL